MTTNKKYLNQISYYDIEQIFDGLKNISKENLIDELFQLSLKNALTLINNKEKTSEKFSKQLKQDLLILEKHGIFNIDNNKDSIQNIKFNIELQLMEPLPPKLNTNNKITLSIFDLRAKYIDKKTKKGLNND